VTNICSICYSGAEHPRYQPQERMFGWGDVFDYFQCKECGCLQIDTIPVDLARYYPPEYYSLSATPRSPVGWFLRQLNRRRLQFRLTGKHAAWERFGWRFKPLAPAVTQLTPYLKPVAGLDVSKRCLDIGCGEHSEWLEALFQCGFMHLTGVDPFLKHSGIRRGIRYLNTPLESIDEEFDLITLHHSIEHITDQHGTMRQLRRLLAPDGVCIVRIPLVDSMVWERYGLEWVELDAPRHLYLHTRNSLVSLAKAEGMTLRHVLYDSTAFEFAGSEQYRAGIPLVAPNSFWVNPQQSIFSDTQMQQFHDQAAAANQAGNGGRAAFYLYKNEPT
jgi:SAM-dependent methyltransferase